MTARGLAFLALNLLLLGGLLSTGWYFRRRRRTRTDGGVGVGHDHDHAHGRESGVLRWLTTVNHRDIGLLYLAFGTLAALWGGIDAMMMRTELLTPATDVWSPETYNALFTTHGITMLFLFVMPVFFGITNYVLPLLIGADDLAFPRINALGFWLLPPSLLLVRAGLITDLLGSVLGAVVAIPLVQTLLALQPPAIGWTMYTPLSLQSPNPQLDFFLLGLHLSGISTTMGAINFIVTIVTERADDVGWADLDIFTWSMLTTSALILFAFPLLGSAIIMLLFDRNFGTTFFLTPGGGPLLWQHLFWFFGHPEVYIIFLPATGLMSTILPKFSGRRIFGFSFIVYSTLAIGVLSFGVWAHHMFVTGIDPRIRASFMAVSLAIAVPSAIKVFNWLTTMWKGNLRLTAPMWLMIGGIGTFILGGVTGVVLAAIPVNVRFHGTYFVVGHFHLILMAIIPFMMFAASYYWFPLIFERMYDRRLARVQSVLLVAGSTLTFSALVVIGLFGMPRRYASYPPSLAVFQQVASVGAFVVGLSVLLWLYIMTKSIVAGPRLADADVWDLKRTGQFTREWRDLEERLDEKYGVTPTEPPPEEWQPAAIELVEDEERRPEGAPRVLEDLTLFGRDLAVGAVGGVVGIGLMMIVLFGGLVLGVFDLTSFEEFGRLFFLPSVLPGLGVFLLAGATIWPLVYVSLVNYLPFEADLGSGFVLGSLLAPGFILGFYSGQEGLALAGFLLVSFLANWVYGVALAVTFGLLSRYVSHSVTGEDDR